MLTTTEQVKLLTLTRRGLYTSYVTYARHRHAEQWNSHHTVRFRFHIRRRISGRVSFRLDFKKVESGTSLVCGNCDSDTFIVLYAGSAKKPSWGMVNMHLRAGSLFFVGLPIQGLENLGLRTPTPALKDVDSRRLQA